MIDIKNVTHHYSIRPVLRGVNLHVRRGELMALVGPNGMGKSTLLGVMAGVLAPVEGEVIIDGRVRRSTVEDEIAIRKRVDYLPNEAWLPNELTGRDFILRVGRLYQDDDLKLMDHADRLLGLFNLNGDHAINSYSTGQRKKIGLASALITDAEILLLDEPFSGGLDPSGIFAMTRVLRRLAEREDRTVVMATPVPTLIEEVADRVAIIENGEITQVGTLEELRQISGKDGDAAEVLQHLMHPETSQLIDDYFVDSASSP